MPCYGPSPEEERNYEARERRAAEKQLAKTEAMLCAILSNLEDTKLLVANLDEVNWEEAGVKRKDFEAWWKEHKALDRQRRLREQKARDAAMEIAAKKAAREELRKQALSKLSLAERRALGIK